MSPPHVRLYAPVDSPHIKWKLDVLCRTLSTHADTKLVIKAENCFHIILKEGTNVNSFESSNIEKLQWLLSQNPFKPSLSKESKLRGTVKEVGPRLTFKTAYCTNALSAFRAAGIYEVIRVEKSIRYEINGGLKIEDDLFLELAGDRMTEFLYPDNIDFSFNKNREEFFEIDILGDIANLEKANKELGLALDKIDLEYYGDLFINKLKRNPTDVELFDLAQSDSEHSRHWFFRGRLIVDGNERKDSLMKTIRETQDYSNNNNLIAFCDNSSAIKGFPSVQQLLPVDPSVSSPMRLVTKPRHLIYSAETHNFPTAVCPFQGATTGTGGRIRDIHATGKGAHEIAGVAGYAFGNLHLENYHMPWEDENEKYPLGFSHPRQVAIEASNGASDYGNKFGEPVLCGFARSFGQRLVNGQRSEYVKPIMFSGGIGAIDDEQIFKDPCCEGMLLAKIGGPIYRIGVGGGAASSFSVQGTRDLALDFGAVQRGDAEMGQKLHRVVRACAEMGKQNPILSIHDQGAGGNGNVLKELVEGGGAIIESEKFELGDDTISVRELWTAEYQENDACLVDPTLVEKMFAISQREKCKVSVVGHVAKEQRVILKNFSDSIKTLKHPVDFDTKVLGDRDKKVFHLSTVPFVLQSLQLPANLTSRMALEMVLRLPSVASKRYLTCKVDRSVTGLIARQQCVGPLHTPLADVAVVALSHFDKIGGAVAVGEQPIKTLISPSAGARMSIAETLTNLVFAPITDIRDVKMSGNWMWAAKCEGEGAKLVEACDAMCKALAEAGCAVDGGKDSLSMAAIADGEVVKAPGTLVLSAYVPCVDITKVVTPDLKGPTDGADCSTIIYVRMGSSLEQNRLGGSALAQVLKQIGDEPADMENVAAFVSVFNAIQGLIIDDVILAGHDVSDGGFITALLEMAFAGNIEIVVNIQTKADPLAFLFAEEPGLFLEVNSKDTHRVVTVLTDALGETIIVGSVRNVYGSDAKLKININGESIVNEGLIELREIWEETSDQLGLLQTDKDCLKQAKLARAVTKKVTYYAPFEWSINTSIFNDAEYLSSAPRIAIIREEGSNGDREMAAAFTLAGFQTYDVTMTDMLAGHTLDAYRGIAFVGGFSFADVLGSAKGWAATIQYNPTVYGEFERFKNRSDTLSLGVCNGCQLMSLLGWIGEYDGIPSVFLDENLCGRFESVFGPVRIEKSEAIMLRGMEGAILGLWSSHGEGRFTYRSPSVHTSLKDSNLITLRYTDSEGNPTQMYPGNPNGSQDAVAGICSRDGRHLAMMPHPDRAFMEWHWAEYPRKWRRHEKTPVSPWIKMFQNAFEWIKEADILRQA